MTHAPSMCGFYSISSQGSPIPIISLGNVFPSPHSKMSVCLVLRQHETVIPGELPLVQELTCTLREWAVIWRNLYVVSVLQGWGAAVAIPGPSTCLSVLLPRHPLRGVGLCFALCGERSLLPGPHNGWQPADSHFPGIGSLTWDRGGK